MRALLSRSIMSSSLQSHGQAYQAPLSMGFGIHKNQGVGKRPTLGNSHKVQPKRKDERRNLRTEKSHIK